VAGGVAPSAEFRQQVAHGESPLLQSRLPHQVLNTSSLDFIMETPEKPERSDAEFQQSLDARQREVNNALNT
jgi:hypothetical protein